MRLSMGALINGHKETARERRTKSSKSKISMQSYCEKERKEPFRKY